MPFVEEISNYIVAQSTVFGAAPSSTSVPLWIGEIGNSSPDTAVGLYDSGGAAPEYVHGGVSYERPSIQIVSRSSAHAIAKLNADIIWNLLANVFNVSIAKSSSTGVTNYITITPNQSPFEIGEDPLRRRRFACNFFVQKEVS